jgi:predicted NBD/HSP70 family sugar kinase
VVRTSSDSGVGGNVAGTGTVANTTAVVRIMNERAVYEQVRRLGPVSASQLVAATGLSKPTIGLALGSLERAGLIRHVGHRVGQVGRAPRLYEIRPEAGWALAIDIGGSWLRAAVADLAGRIAVRHEERVRARTAASLLRQIGELAESVPAKAGLAFADVTHTVLGIPGVYEPATDEITTAPNLPGWDGPWAVESLRARLGEHFSIDNDVNLATLAEQAYGLGATVRDFVFVSVGTGVGMGIMVDGRLYRGPHGRAGEISFLPVGDQDAARVADAPSTRQHGILETVASAEGVVAAAVRLGMAVESAEQVFDAARAGDELALRVLDVEVDHLARALTSVTAVLDPGLIVLGGGVGSNVDVLLEPIHRRLRELLPFEPPPIRASAVGRENVVLGGLAAGLDTARDMALARMEA